VSCARKRELYAPCRNTDNLELTRHYKKYCKVLTDVIKLAKKCYYNRLIQNFKNKIKTSWGIIRFVTNANSSKNTIPIINIDGKLHNNIQIIVNAINNYFSAPTHHMQFNTHPNVLDSLNYLSEVYKYPRYDSSNYQSN
jgi:hypothetical protein